MRAFAGPLKDTFCPSETWFFSAKIPGNHNLQGNVYNASGSLFWPRVKLVACQGLVEEGRGQGRAVCCSRFWSSRRLTPYQPLFFQDGGGGTSKSLIPHQVPGIPPLPGPKINSTGPSFPSGGGGAGGFKWQTVRSCEAMCEQVNIHPCPSWPAAAHEAFWLRGEVVTKHGGWFGC